MLKIVNFVLLICSFSCLIGSERDHRALLDYRIKNDTYAVVYVESPSTSHVDKKQALKHAAEVAHAHGYKYFIVNSEEKVSVSLAGSEGQSFIFYEHLEGEFINSYAPESYSSDGMLYPGLKITYTCYKDQPPFKGKVFVVSEVKDMQASEP